MASSKPETAARPLSAQRHASSTGPLNVPARNGTPRSHSHSFSLGALNGGHRVARRKSMSINNMSGTAAAVQGMDEAALEALVSSTPEAHSATIHRPVSSLTVRPETSPHAAGMYQGASGSLANGGSDEKPAKIRPGPKGSKARRASEGAYLSKSERKRTSGDIRCETCGKGYKHSSCLTKHLWEHTPQWQVTSKLLISKHQQVQMLEAASVLVTMNVAPTVEVVRPVEDSDRSSASPLASGFSAVQDNGISSAETTPPPMIEEEDEDEEDEEMDYSVHGQPMQNKDHYRYSSTSSVFSASYQSAPSMAGSIPTAASYNSNAPLGLTHRRPSTSGTAYSVMHADDENKLAAAVENVSFGTPRTGPIEAGIPPVPPLPPQYASHKATLSSSAIHGLSDMHMHPGLTSRLSDERGGYQSPPSGEGEHTARRSASRGHADDQQGMFAMEE